VLLNKVYDYHTGLEQKFVAGSEFRDISVNDMHIIDAIGPKMSRNMSAVAKMMRVTVGTLTIAVNNLVKKGYIVRGRSEKDRRVVLISLSGRGEAAYHHHQQFYEQMGAAMKNELDRESLRKLERCLQCVIGEGV